MWIRLQLAPWWVPWIAMAFLTAAFAGPFWLLLQGPDTHLGWPMSFAATGFGAFMATLASIAQRPTRRAMATAVNGLDRAGRARAITAARHGDVPTDPHILAAAIGLCTASLGGRVRRNPYGWWPRIIPWIGPAVAIAPAPGPVRNHHGAAAVSTMQQKLAHANRIEQMHSVSQFAAGTQESRRPVSTATFSGQRP